MGRSCVALVLAIALVLSQKTHAQATISCSTVASSLVPCVGYLQTGSPSPPTPACCDGVQGLNSMASTIDDRQAACKCIKQQSAVINPEPQFVSALPEACGVDLGYTINATTDCDTVR